MDIILLIFQTSACLFPLTLTTTRKMSDKSDAKTVTFEELQKHSNKENLYILVHKKGVSQ